MTDNLDIKSDIADMTVKGRRVAVGQGVTWIKEGWRLFIQSQGIWILIAAMSILIFGLLEIIPWIGQIASQLLTPVLGGGLFLGCRALTKNEPLRISYFFAGFRQETGNLVLLSVFYLIGLSLVVMVCFLIGGATMLIGLLIIQGYQAEIAFFGALFAMLAGFALFMPLLMAMWFAPALVILEHIKPWTAMKMSFYACLSNFLPQSVYTIIVFFLAVLAAIPFGLGFLVFIPVLIGSVYASYVDIFN